MSNIAFVGLGNMGAGMAANLIKAGHELVVYDLVQSQMESLVSQGAKAASSPQSAVRQADVIISMLPAGKHVESLYADILEQTKSNTLLIDCSTIEAATARKLHGTVTRSGRRFVDAPVSGGVAGAAAGTLTFIIGGDDETVAQAIPILKQMGQHCFHAGGAGAGQVAKICNNMLLAILMAGTSEALQLGIDNGLDPKVMSQIMQQSSGNNWTLQKYNPVPGVMENVPASKDYTGGFMVDLMNKDLNLAMDTACSNKSLTPLGALAQSLYQIHAKQGNGKLDFSSIFKMFNESK